MQVLSQLQKRGRHHQVNRMGIKDAEELTLKKKKVCKPQNDDERQS